MYPDFQVAVFEFPIGNRIVKILGIDRVNGESKYVTEIFPGFDFFGRDLFGDRIGLFVGFFGIFERQSEFGHDGVDFHFVQTCLAEDPNDFSRRVFISFSPFGEFDDDFFIMLSTHQFTTVNKDVLVHFLEIGHHKCKSGRDFHSTHKFVSIAF